MSKPINTYPVFESNQVLTSAQLNALTSYLDQQNRLTRIKLIGIGVVCGLKVDLSDDNNSLIISKGAGVTSQGYLITLNGYELTHYRPYSLPRDVNYTPFTGNDGEQDISLYELLTPEAEVHPEEDIYNISNIPRGDVTSLEDYVVMLFLEIFDNDIEPCLTNSCDELGIDRIMNVRKLLISKVDLETVKNRTEADTVDERYSKRYALPVIKMKRPVLKPNDGDSSYNYPDMANDYKEVIDGVKNELMGIGTSPGVLMESYNAYLPVLEIMYTQHEIDIATVINDIKSTLEDYLNPSTARYMAYSMFMIL